MRLPRLRLRLVRLVRRPSGFTSGIDLSVVGMTIWLKSGGVMSRVCLLLWVALLPACAVMDQPSQPTPRIVNRYVERTVTVEAKPSMASCDMRKRSSHQMASCAEAMHSFEVCHVDDLDGSPRNGIPCQALCGDDVATMCDRVRRAPFFISDGRMSKSSGPASCNRT